jgi:hypothetical protein
VPQREKDESHSRPRRLFTRPSLLGGGIPLRSAK